MPAFDIVEVAREFAIRIHTGQLYGTRPYPVHLVAAVGVARRFPHLLTPEIEATIWLHDTKEDRKVTDTHLMEIGMPELVRDIVESVTDEAGATRRERKARTYPKTVKRWESVFTKLVERIASVEDGALRDMYAREHAAFRTALYRPDHGLDAVWAELDRLLIAP